MMDSSFFGFDTTMQSRDDDDADEGLDEEEYDALNAETFGNGDGENLGDDWEEEHERLAIAAELKRTANITYSEDEFPCDIEESLERLVLDDDAPITRNDKNKHKNLSNHAQVFFNKFLPQSAEGSKTRVRTVEEIEREFLNSKNQAIHNSEAIHGRVHLSLTSPPPFLVHDGVRIPTSFPTPPPAPLHHLAPSNSLSSLPPLPVHVPMPAPGEKRLRDRDGMGERKVKQQDPYAGLMTAKDRQWLTNIQILQLNAQKPYTDDYYYTVYHMKQRAARERAGERVEQPKREQRTLERKAYTPAHFEGSLGKLQVLSFTAPRKIIDMEMVNTDGNDSNPSIKDTKRTKQTLIEIERLYSYALMLEDSVSNIVEARVSVADNKEEIINKVITILNYEPGRNDRITLMLCVRKGKNLMLRLLPHLNISQQLGIWTGMFKTIWSVIRKDMNDQLLPEFITRLANFLRQLNDFKQFSLLFQAFINDDETTLKMPLRQPPLPVALTNQFGVSVLILLLNKSVEFMPSIKDNEDWQRFINRINERSKDLTTIATPLVCLTINAANTYNLTGDLIKAFTFL